MTKKIRIGVAGYGNLGRGVELAIAQNPDLELFGVFTRRDPASLSLQTPGAQAYKLADAAAYADQIDVADSFDTHAKIPEHFAAVDEAARKGNHLALISAGWDPGLFSLNRLYASAVLPEGRSYTFWAAAFRRGTATRSAAFPALRTPSSTPCRWKLPSRRCAKAKTPI